MMVQDRFRSDCAEVIKWNEFDSLDKKAGEYIEQLESVNLFLHCQNKDRTKADTSLQMSGQLPMPQHLNVERLIVLYAQTNDSDDNKEFASSGHYEFWIGQKIYDRAPLARFTGHVGQYIDIEKLLMCVEYAQALGFNIAGDYVNYKIGNEPIGHHILQGQTFGFNIFFNKKVTFNKDFRFMVMLDGVISRGVS